MKYCQWCLMQGNRDDRCPGYSEYPHKDCALYIEDKNYNINFKEKDEQT